MYPIDPTAEKPAATNPVPSLAAMPGMKLLRMLAYQEAGRAMTDPENRAMIAQAAAGLAASLSPANPNEIAQLIRRLAWHYPQPPRLAAAQRAIAEDWLADMAHLPADIIDAACAQWRRAANEYAPTPGQLLALANPIWEQRRTLAIRAERFLEIPAAPATSRRATGAA
tara:strand:+ start:4355 stop:4861 length:507 start_codon:yes stop_codon:yes gene_type:complete